MVYRTLFILTLLTIILRLWFVVLELNKLSKPVLRFFIANNRIWGITAKHMYVIFHNHNNKHPLTFTALLRDPCFKIWNQSDVTWEWNSLVIRNYHLSLRYKMLVDKKCVRLYFCLLCFCLSGQTLKYLEIVI